jgi:hypothetical protein
VVHRDLQAARDLARRKVALYYLPVIVGWDPTCRSNPNGSSTIQSARRPTSSEVAARQIPDELLPRVALAGTPDEVADQAHALYTAEATRFVGSASGNSLTALTLPRCKSFRHARTCRITLQDTAGATHTRRPSDATAVPIQTRARALRPCRVLGQPR